MKKFLALLCIFTLIFSSVEFSAYGYTTHEVAVGKTITLKRTTSVQNIYSVVWSSDSSAVSIESQGISSCTIKGVREERLVTITANIYYYIYSGTYTYANSTNEAFVVNVTAAQDTSVKPTSISLTSSLSLSVGESSQLSPNIQPSNATKTCTWSSSDSSVATVSSGRVTAAGPGSATITAKTTNGLKATCIVYVSEVSLDVSSTFPKSNEENVDINQAIKIKYNTNIYENTNYSKIKLMDKTAVTTVSGVASIDGVFLIFTPSAPLIAGHNYVFYVPKNALKNSENSGNPSDETLSFRTAALVLSEVTPKNNSKNIEPNAHITLTFDLNIKKGKSYENISLIADDGSEVTLKKTISGNTLNLVPTTPLFYNTTYKLSLPSDALTNADGFSHKSEISISFLTKASPLEMTASTPENNAKNTSCAPQITLEFNDSIATKSDLSKAYFLNKSDKSRILANGIINDSHVTFSPSGMLDVMTVYYLVVPAGSLTSVSGVTNQKIELSFTTTSFRYGDGTKDNPYQINTIDELFAFSSNSSTFDGEYIELKTDINLSKDRAWKPKSEFRGTFDGGGHTIFGLYYSDYTYSTENVGFIDKAICANIKNLSLEDVDISLELKGTDYHCNMGGLCGYASSTEISKCSVTGNIYSHTIKDNRMNIGGLIGYYYRSYLYYPIYSCYSDVNINAERECSFASYPIAIGGIVGYNEYVNDTNCGLMIDNCFNSGTIKIEDTSSYPSHAGGIVGNAQDCYAQKCYNTGQISIDSRSSNIYSGAITGFTSATYTKLVKVIDCYSLSDISTSGGRDGTSVSADLMKKSETFVDWNFDNIWVIDEAYNNGYPLQKCFVYPTIYSLNATNSGGIILADIKTKNLPDVAKVLIALYDKNDCLLEYKEIGIDDVQVKFSENTQNAAYIKAYAWDTQTLEPLSKCVEYELN